MERVREFEEVQRKDSETLQWRDRRKEQEGKGGKINGKEDKNLQIQYVDIVYHYK